MTDAPNGSCLDGLLDFVATVGQFIGAVVAVLLIGLMAAVTCGLVVGTGLVVLDIVGFWQWGIL